ncbi:MAG: TIGR02757 family protein [Leptospiraceae bacterium]
MKEILELMHQQYNSSDFLDSDPLALVHEQISRAPEDQEIVSLLAALFAYGRVSSIQSFLRNLLPVLTDAPHGFLLDLAASKTKLKTRFPYYRFQSSTDVQTIVRRMAEMVFESKENPSDLLPLERFFGTPQESTLQRISAFQHSFVEGIPKSRRTSGLVHWIGQSTGRGARKRLCLYLRWMVRTGYPDLGLYRSFSPADLIVPLDVHMARIGQNLEFTGRKTNDWEMAAQISLGLSLVHPEDPLKYDFALTRPGILGGCTGRWNSRVCPGCNLRSICIQARKKT